MGKRQPLDAWIHEAITDTEKDGKISAIACVHVIGQNHTKEVYTVKFADRIWQPKELAALFIGKCEAYSQDLPGQQFFCLNVFYGGRTEPEASHPFIIRTTDAGTHMGILSDPANTEGQTQQGMRHIEVMAQTYVRGISSLVQQQSEFVNALAKRCLDVEHENREMSIIFKQMMIDKVEAEHNKRMAVLTFERETQERKKWLSYVPSLVNNLLGKEVFPQNTEDTALIEAAAEHLTEEQIKLLAGVLPAELWGPLSARLTKHLKTKREEAEAARTLAASITSKDPEADAAGDVEGTTKLLTTSTNGKPVSP